MANIAEARPTSRDSDAEIAAEVLRIEGSALLEMSSRVPNGFTAAVDILLAARGRVIVSGIGKSGHVGRKIAATLASTGTPASFVHPSEASHGDLGMVGSDDVCLFLSNSGETRELHDLVVYARRFAIPVISLTKNSTSTLASQSDVTLVLPDAPEACAIGLAPTTSTTCALALGDALAVALMRRRGFSPEAFHRFHPGGKLGARFLRVRDLMHVGDNLPRVSEHTLMGEVLVEMSAKGFGIAAVVQGNRLAGVISDGDLRRNLEGLLDRLAAEVATKSPRTVTPETLASEALRIMNETKITTLLVVERDKQLAGLLHIHDLLRAGVM